MHKKLSQPKSKEENKSFGKDMNRQLTRGHTEGKRTHETAFDIIAYQGSAN